MLNRVRSLIARARRSRGSHQSAQKAQSIFELIAAQVSLNPNSAIDESLFPKILLGDESELSYAPGVLDAVIAVPSGVDKGCEIIKEIILYIDTGKLSEWEQVEAMLRGIRAITSVDEVLGALARSEISLKATRLFWAMAKHSSDYEVIKWGIALGSLGAEEEKLYDLLLFARHPEFTVYCSVALLRMAAAKPELKRYLIELLPLSKQWGVISLIRRIVREPALIYDVEVQRKVLIYGMENNDGIPMEVAFTIAENINLSSFFHLAESDQRVYVAIFQLLNTLITQPNPLGGIDQLPDGHKSLAEYVQLLRKRPTDVRMLSALDVIRDYLVAREEPNDEQTALLFQVRQLWKDRFDEGVMRDALKHADTRWLTLTLIGKLRVDNALPEVREAFKREPDAASISVLAELGTAEDLQMLFVSIPRLVNVEDRRGKKMSSINVFGPESKGAYEYGRIVEALGRLATPDAISHIKLAANDYDPMVRLSACRAFAKLPIDKVDAEIASLIHKRLNDPMAYVREAAKQTRAKLVV